MRLRSTALPAERGTAKATRGTSPPRDDRARRSQIGPSGRPSSVRARSRRARERAANVARSRTGRIRRTVACGREPGGHATRRDLRAKPSGRGNRASSCACGCWAGTCASRSCLLRRPRQVRGVGTAREAEAPSVRALAPQPQRGRSGRAPTLRTRARPLFGAPIDPCRARGAVLRCAPRVAAAGVANFPGGLRLDKAASGGSRSS